MVVFAFGLLLLIALWVRKVRGAILLSIVATTILAIVVEAIGDPKVWSLTVPEWPGFGDLAKKPDFGTLGEFSLIGSFEEVGVVAALLFVFTLMLADFFDTMGTMTAIGAEGDLLDERGHPAERRADPGRRLRRRRRGRPGRCLVEHQLHRVRLGCR